MEGIEEISFAIFDEGVNLRVFREVFEDVDVGSKGISEFLVGGKEKRCEIPRQR